MVETLAGGLKRCLLARCFGFCDWVSNARPLSALDGQEAADDGEFGFSVERVVDPVAAENGAEDPPAPDVEHAVETRIDELERAVFFQDAVDRHLVPERVRVEEGFLEHCGDFPARTEYQDSAVKPGRGLVHHAADLSGFDRRQRWRVSCDEDIRVEKSDHVHGPHPFEIVQAALLPGQLFSWKLADRLIHHEGFVAVAPRVFFEARARELVEKLRVFRPDNNGDKSDLHFFSSAGPGEGKSSAGAADLFPILRRMVFQGPDRRIFSRKEMPVSRDLALNCSW